MSATSGGVSVSGIRVGGGGSGSVNESSETGESSHSTMSITDSPSTSFQTNHEANVTKISLEDKSVPGSAHVDMTDSNVNLTMNERHSAEGVVNMGFDQDEEANRGEVEFKSINGELKADKVSEAVNLELVNMVPYSNGNSGNYGVPVNGIPVKKDCEGGDLSSPYDEYFVPVNEHKKYMRGEKLYVTKDKRRPTSWRKCLSWIVACAVVSAILIVAILAGTGVILSQDPNEIKKVSVGRNLGDSNTKPLVTKGSSDSQEELAVGKWISNIENMTHRYVPRSVEFTLPIDNSVWNPAYLNNNSAEYQSLLETTKNYLQNILLHKDIFDLNKVKPEFNMISISQQPFQVLYRMGWNSEKEANNSVDSVIIQNIKNKLIENLNGNGSYINKYHINTERIHVGGVPNLCLKSNGGCSHICYYNYQNQQFSCSCPENMKLDSSLHICMGETESSEKDYASIPSINYPENNFESSEVGNNEHYSHDHSDHSTHAHSDHSAHDHGANDYSTYDHSDHSTHAHSDHSAHDHGANDYSTHDHSDHSAHDHGANDYSTHDHSDHSTHAHSDHATHDHGANDYSTHDHSDHSTHDHDNNDHFTHDDKDLSKLDHNDDSIHNHRDHLAHDNKNHDHFTHDNSDYEHSKHDHNNHFTQDDFKDNFSHDLGHKSSHEHDFGHYTSPKNTDNDSLANFDANHEVNYKVLHESSSKPFSDTTSIFNLKDQKSDGPFHEIVINSTASSELEIKQNEKFPAEMDKKLTSTESPSFNKEHLDIDVPSDLQELHQSYGNNHENPTTIEAEPKDHQDHFNDQTVISMSSQSSHDSSLETTSSTQSYFSVNPESNTGSINFSPSTTPTSNADFSNVSHHHHFDSGNDEILHSLIDSNTENAKNVSVSNNLGQSDSEHTISNSNGEKPDIYKSTEYHHHVPLLEEILIKDSSLNSTENQEISKNNVPGQTFLNNVEVNAKGEPVVEEIVIDKSSPQGTEPSIMNPDNTSTSNYQLKHVNQIESKNESFKKKDILQSSVVESGDQSDEKTKTIHIFHTSENTTGESIDLNNNKSNLGDIDNTFQNQSNIVSPIENTHSEFNNQNKSQEEIAYQETPRDLPSNSPEIEKNIQKTENDFTTQSNWLPEESTTILNKDLKSNVKNYSNQVFTASNEEISVNDTEMHPELKTSLQTDITENLEQKANVEEESTSTPTFSSSSLEINLNDTNSSKLIDGFFEMNKSKSIDEIEPTESVVHASKYNESDTPEWDIALKEGNNKTLSKPLLLDQEMTNKSSSKTVEEIPKSESSNSKNDQAFVHQTENEPMKTEIPNNYETTDMAFKKFEKPENNHLLIAHPSKVEVSEKEHKTAKESENKMSSPEQTMPKEPFAGEIVTTTITSFSKEESKDHKADELNNQKNVKPTEPYLVSQEPYDHYTQPIHLENTNTDDLSNNIKDELIDNDEFNTLLDKNYKNDYLNDSKEVFNKYSNKQIFLKNDKKKLKELNKLDKAELDKKTTKSYITDKDYASQKHTTENNFSSNYGIHVEPITSGVTEATKNDGGLSVNIPVPSEDPLIVDNPDHGTLFTVSPIFEVDKQTSDLDGENNKDDLFDSKEDFKSEKDYTKSDKDHKYDKQKSGKKKDLKKKGSSKDGKNVELDESKKYHFEITEEKNETLRPNYSFDQENSKENLGVTVIPMEHKVMNNQGSSESDLKGTTLSSEIESAHDYSKNLGANHFSPSHNATFVPVLEEATNVTQQSPTTDASIEKVTQSFETHDHDQKSHTTDPAQVEYATVSVETSTDVTIPETDNATRENIDTLKLQSSVVDSVKSGEKGVDGVIEPDLEKENGHVEIEGSSTEKTFSNDTQEENVSRGAKDQINHSVEVAPINFNNETVPLEVSEVLLVNNVSAASPEITNDARHSENVAVGEGATSKEHFAFEVLNTTHEIQTESKNFGSELNKPHPVTVLDGITFETFDSTKNASIDQKLIGENGQHSSFSLKPVLNVTVTTAQSNFSSSINNGDSSIFSVKSTFSGHGSHQDGHEVKLQNSSAFAIRGGETPIRRVLNYSTTFEGPYTIHNVGSSIPNKTRMNQFGEPKDVFYDEVGGTLVSQSPNFAFANNFNNLNVTHFNVENESVSGTSFDGHFTPPGIYHHSLTNSSPSFIYSNTRPSFTIKGDSGDFGRSIVYILGNNTKSGVNSSMPTRTHHVIFKNSTVFALGNVTEENANQSVGAEKTLMDSERATAKNLLHFGRNSSVVVNVINKFGDHIGFISKCAAGQFQCINGTSRRGSACIDLSSKCDSINDCTDGSDEIGCVENNCQGNFQCSDGACLKRHLVCNGIVECADGSDEKQCENRKCEFDEFKCPSGRCIPLLWHCDGKADCVNHTDEQNCQRSCGNDEYLCPEGWCVPLTYRCNGIKDCSNGEDEQLCDCSVDEFKCQSGGCVLKNQVCNGLDDCPDKSDEWNCMRLQQDSMLLEIKTPDGEYEPICSDMWSLSLSDQVCASLGYASSTAMVEDTDSVPFPSDKPFYILKNSTDLKDNNNILNNLLRKSNNTCLSKKLVKIMCQEFSCGSRSMTEGSAFEGRLVGGVSANTGQWPSVALLYNVRNMHSCTANVLTPRWVLASYNCLKSGNKNFNLKDWKFFGGSTIFDTKKESGETRNITEVVTHPQMKFNQFLYSNDLALVKLDKSLSFSNTLGAVCLPQQPIHSRLICVTAGWGKNGVEDESLSQQLQYLPVPTMNLTDCNSTEHYSGFITDDEICAGYSTIEKSLCYNDEGAPLMCINKRGEWELQGTLTYHDNCGRGSHPSIFNSIKTANEWIKKTIGSSVDKNTYIAQR